MSVWLTPELKPFYGGPIFHPKTVGRPGFVAILTALAQAWANEQEQLLTEGERVTKRSGNIPGAKTPNGKFQIPKAKPRNPDPKNRNAEPDLGVLVAAGNEAGKECFRQLAESYDGAHADSAGRPKFPRAAVSIFSFRSAVGPIAETGTATWIREKAEFSPARPITIRNRQRSR